MLDIEKFVEDNEKNNLDELEVKNEPNQKKKEKIFFKILTRIIQVFLMLLILLLILILGAEIIKIYNYNHKYSIPMPIILGEFRDYSNKENSIRHVSVFGLESIVNDDIASLNINETSCFITNKSCIEKRAVALNLYEVSIFPYYNEYKITYIDENKILFKSVTSNDVTGEIDLNHKTLFYTVKNAGFNGAQTRKIEIITDNQRIEELEKKIIRKYLKMKLFGKV